MVFSLGAKIHAATDAATITSSAMITVQLVSLVLSCLAEGYLTFQIHGIRDVEAEYGDMPKYHLLVIIQLKL